MLSLGTELSLAFCTALWRVGLASRLPPPSRAATSMKRSSLLHIFERWASAAPFLRLIVDHFECPDISPPPGRRRARGGGGRRLSRGESSPPAGGPGEPGQAAPPTAQALRRCLRPARPPAP